jgi:uncharacterized protein YdeI (YjbR/CyaY-like superfamily)
MASERSKKSAKVAKKTTRKAGAKPADLRRSLAASPSADAAWKDLTPIARRDFTSWITSAKQPETRERRIKIACENLAAGKRRPCCYAVVPMDLYRALGAAPKAKAQWSDLTPAEKRDFTDWVESAGEREVRKGRIERACAMLAAGKRRLGARDLRS